MINETQAVVMREREKVGRRKEDVVASVGNSVTFDDKIVRV